MWTPDWLRRFRSGKIISVELTGRNDAAIANRQSTWASLENAGFDILVLDDEEKSFWKSSSQLCDKYGLPYHVKSGGSIIDFDCTHSASDNNSALTRSVCLCLLYLIYLMLIIIYIRRELSLTCLFNFCIQRREWGPSYINYHMTSNRFV